MIFLSEQGSKPDSNRLINEKSPYLLQHAYNPVDWYSWGEEAFEKAKKEDKPIFLSIGYSTCHWCHVMEYESFEDQDVADLMNDVFVSIKVDREERPDIDKVYMQVATMMTGRGGWPLTILMTPDKDPFYAATYIPKEGRYGRLGMMDLIPQIDELWKTKRESINEAIDQIQGAFSDTDQPRAKHEITLDTINMAFGAFSSRFDDKNGGIGNAPKFPSPHNLLLILRYWKRTGDDWALHIVETTLQKMRHGGIFDHVGFGFHRYSTDAKWLLPHFEKMLYDQAMLALAYTEAYQATKKQEYADVVKEIFEYVLRDLTSPEGGFYSAEDADSEGVEGKFYVWSEEEIRSILSDQEADSFIKMHNIRTEGNFRDEATNEETGLNIPHVTTTIQEASTSLSVDFEVIPEILESARLKLFAHREKRVRPQRDDKILTDWNGLMIASMAKAARILDEPDYIEAAIRAMDFLLKTMDDKEGNLYHRYRDGDVAIPAFLDDYAFIVWGLLELYETTFSPKYLELAQNFNLRQIDHFLDKENGAYFYTGDYSEKLLVRQKEAYDGAIPSGNSIAMLNAVRLARLLGSSELDELSSRIVDFFSSDISRAHTGFSMMLLAVDFAIGPSYEIVIAGDQDSEDTKAMIKAIREEFIPNKVVLLRGSKKQSDKITKLAPFTKFHTPMNDRATAHVCVDHNCKLPTTDMSQMLLMLKGNQTP
ncbi:MAG: thioredoxin domain-containing protein [Candidatus Thorarchaeota archaeon]